MAATKQEVRPATVTREESFLGTKRNLAIAISSIAYLRHLFPSDAFKEQKINTMRVWILKRDSEARQIVDLMSGVYDALEKEYLKKLILAISYKSTNTGKDILETYTFGFSYAGKGIISNLKLARSGQPTKSTPMTSEDTKKSAQKFIKNLFMLVSALEEIGPSFAISMRLSYYDERMPVGYQPPGFEAGDLSGIDLENEIEAYNIGTMEQGYHTTSLTVRRVQLLKGPTEFATCEANAPLSQPNRTLENAVLPSSEQEPHTPLQQIVQNVNNSQMHGTQVILRCPCGCNESDGAILRCMSCMYWQHAVCFCVCPDSPPEVHVCSMCADPSKRSLYPTDVTLCDLNDKRLREVCNWRRALEACFTTTSITVNSLSARLSCSKQIAKKIVDRMVLDRIAIPNKDRKGTKDINKANLESAYYRDIQKPSADMRQQAAEARLNMESPVDRLVSVKHRDVLEQVEAPDSAVQAVRYAKRRLGMDSQEHDFKVPKKLKSSTRC